MKQTVFPLVLCFLLLSACSDNEKKQGGEIGIIDVAEAFKAQTSLALSDLGKDVRYIPLETTDSSVVAISALTAMAVTDKHILVGARSVPIKIFDKATGRYLGQVGQIGGGPEEYPNGTSFQVDPITGNVYVFINVSKYQCYDSNGRFLKTVNLEKKLQGMMVASYCLGDTMYTYVNLPNEHTTMLSCKYDVNTGIAEDSLPFRWTNKEQVGKPEVIAPLAGAEMLGGRGFLSQLDDQRWTYGHKDNVAYWYQDKELRLKDFYCDTIFTVKSFTQFKPHLVFRMGDMGGFERYEKESAMANKYFLTRTLEAENSVYFIMMKNMYDINGWLKGQSKPTYCGVYNKNDGSTKIMEKVLFRNDMEGMPPFVVYNVSTEGELFGCYQTDALIEARENIPASQQPGWLKQLKEEDNPVILLVK